MSIRTIASLTSIRFVGLIVGVGYSIVNVHCFGTSREADVYVSVTLLFSSVLSLSQSGQLAEIFLPEFHRLTTEHNRETAIAAFNVVLTWLMIPVLLLSFLAIGFAVPLVGFFCSGYEPSAQVLAVAVFRVCCLFIGLEISGALIKTVLNAESVFGRPESTALIVDLTGIVILSTTSARLGIWSLVLVFSLGKLLSMAVYLRALYTIRIRIRPRWSVDGFDHLRFFRTMFSTVSYALCTQFYSLTIQMLLTKMPGGTAAIYGYTTRLHTRLRGVFVQPVLTVFFTDFSKAVRGESDAAESMSKAVNLVVGGLGFVALLTAVFANDLLSVIWGSEKFRPTDVEFASEVVAVNSLALVVTSVGGVFRKVAVSNGRGKAVFLLAAVCQLVSSAFIFSLSSMLGRDALKWFLFQNVCLLSFASWLVAFIADRRSSTAVDWKTVIRLLSILAVVLISAWWIHAAIVMPDGRLGAACMVAGVCLALTCTYVVMLYAVNVPGFRLSAARLFKRLQA